MGALGRCLVCALVFLTVTSLTVLTISSVVGQGVAKLYVPQFSVRYVDDAYRLMCCLSLQLQSTHILAKKQSSPSQDST